MQRRFLGNSLNTKSLVKCLYSNGTRKTPSQYLTVRVNVNRFSFEFTVDISLRETISA